MLGAVLQRRRHCTWNAPAARHCKLPACSRNHKGWTKAITVRSKKAAIGWIFKQLLGCTFSGSTERKMQILPPKSGIHVHTYPHSCIPIVSKHVPNRPKLSGSLIQRKPYRTTFECWFAFPWECGGLPYGHTIRVSWYQKMTSKEAFLNSVWISAHRMLVKVCSFEKGKPLKERVFSSLYLSRTG